MVRRDCSGIFDDGILLVAIWSKLVAAAVAEAMNLANYQEVVVWLRPQRAPLDVEATLWVLALYDIQALVKQHQQQMYSIFVGRELYPAVVRAPIFCSRRLSLLLLLVHVTAILQDKLQQELSTSTASSIVISNCSQRV